MRWPDGMYAALNHRSRSPKQHASTPSGLMSLVAFVIACLALGANYFSKTAASVQTVESTANVSNGSVQFDAEVKVNVMSLTTFDAGRVASLEVQPGEPFTKDTVLVRLDDTSHHKALSRAQRELAQAKRELQIEEASIAHERKRAQAAIERFSAVLLSCDADIQVAQATAKRWDQEQERMLIFKKPHLEL
ncbi:MAG: hypothetical protein CMJ64_01815 [Planctomycetaceae bacterium]|nr:hypothetical protein [Planctomycetaceae bacterium]